MACPSQPYPMSYVPTHNVSDLALDRSYESNSLHSVEPVFRMAEHPFGGGVARTILAAQEADSRPSAKIGTLWLIQQKNTEHASLVPSAKRHAIHRRIQPPCLVCLAVRLI